MVPSEQSLSVRIVAAVAERADVSPTDLPPLYDVIDPDALEDLFSHSTDQPLSVPGRVSFGYAGSTVTVFSDGAVEVTDAAAPATAPEAAVADTD